jgi:hypothetical protein
MAMTKTVIQMSANGQRIDRERVADPMISDMSGVQASNRLHRDSTADV